MLKGMRGFSRYPLFLSAPSLPDDVTRASFREQKRYVVHQGRALRRLARNFHLSGADRRAAREQAEFIRELLGAHPLRDDLSRCIEDTENRVLWRLLIGLRDQANTRIDQTPNLTPCEVLSVFVGKPNWIETRYVGRLTVQAVMDRCTAFRGVGEG